VLRSVRVAATYEKVGLTPRYLRALHLSIFEQPPNKRTTNPNPLFNQALQLIVIG
jgi:hypothetical protein